MLVATWPRKETHDESVVCIDEPGMMCKCNVCHAWLRADF